MYHLDIIGNGRVTLALLKAIFEMKLDKKIEKITVWCRGHKVLAATKVITKEDNINKDIFGIYLMQKAEGRKLAELEKKVEFKAFADLDELMQLKARGGKNVLILAVKYNLDELIYLDLARKEKINPDYPSHFELVLARMRLLLPGIVIDGQRDHDFRERVLLNLKDILMEKQKIHVVINELCKSSSVGYTRLYNMEHSAVGVKGLSRLLKNYHGIVFNMINEVDTTNCILRNFSHLKPAQIISPCENDTIRAKYFLRRNLRLQGNDVSQISLYYIGPHNHTGFVPPEMIKVDGKLLKEILDRRTAEALSEEVTQKVNGFGEDVFLKKGSSDEDTVTGICAVLSSFITEARFPVVRASCFNKDNQLFTGLPGCFQGGIFTPVQDVISGLSQSSRERFMQSIKEQSLINQRILSAIR